MDTRPKYPWRRFWRPRAADAGVLDAGFLIDPEHRIGRYATPGVLATAELPSRRVIVLLGEAGLGKSHELGALRETETTASPGRVVFSDAGEFDEQAALEQALTGTSAFREWVSGEGTLTWMLDGLDEALLDQPRLWAGLVRLLRDCPRERLSLRITCRAAAWPESFGDELAELFRGEHVEILQMLPLRRSDAHLAALQDGIDADAFLDEVDRLAAGPLAATPLTLRMLIDAFMQQRQLPTSMVDLYARGLTCLCERTDCRRDRNAPLPWTSAEALRVSARLAAMLLLCNKGCIFLGRESDAKPTDLTASEIGGVERLANERQLDVTPELLRTLLCETGLYSAAGPSRYQFAHRTYAEFLAADYLSARAVPLAQLRRLLYSQQEGAPRLIPQLQALASWLASMSDAYFNEVSETEPEVLLRSDVALRTAETKALLVSRLLARIRGGDLCPTYDLRPLLGRLAHPELAAQLQGVIADPAAHADVREFAIWIAVESRVGALADAIAEIAVDGASPYELRKTAAYAVEHLDVSTANGKLRPLVVDAADDDPEDALRGCALLATWPEHLTVEELVHALRRPQRPNLMGSYDRFLISGDVPRHATRAGLAPLLEWATTVVPALGSWGALWVLAGQIATRALRDVDDAGIAAALARLVVHRLGGHSGPVFRAYDGERASRLDDTEAFDAGVEARRALLTALVRVLESPSDAFALHAATAPLCVPEDYPWLLEQAAAAPGCEARIWATLARYKMNTQCPRDLDRWMAHAERCPAIAETCDWRNPIELGSPEAEQQRKRWNQIRRAPRAVESIQIEQPTRDRIEPILKECMGGRPGEFHRLVDALLNPGGSPYALVALSEPVPHTPGWKSADEDTRIRIVEAARQFLLHADLKFAESCSYSVARAPALAFHLLLLNDEVFLDQLARERWQLLPAFLVNVPVGSESEQRKTMLMAQRQALEQFRQEASKVISESTRPHALRQIISDLHDCADEVLATCTLRRLEAASLDDDTFVVLLGWLLRQRHPDSRAYAESLLQAAGATDGTPPRSAVLSAVALIVETPGESLPRVWPAITGCESFGRQVLEFIAFHFERRLTEIVAQLSDGQLADLIDWLLACYPVTTDPHHAGAYSPTSDDKIRAWRNGLIHVLERRGTPEACAGLQRLLQRHPEAPWLRAVLIEAESQRRRQAWHPPDPPQVSELIADPTRRMVRSPGELLDIVVESLGRLQTELVGTTPSVANLWNELPYRPKSENHLSDYIKRHLDRDLAKNGVVVNREVEIRRRQVAVAGQPGQECDLIVDAIAHEKHSAGVERFRIIIEVKGCWHPDVRVAMEQQLVDRYLAENECRHGIYVVGCFRCPAWDAADSRRQQAAWPAPQDARGDLDDQARELTKRIHAGEVRAYVLDCALR